MTKYIEIYKFVESFGKLILPVRIYEVGYKTKAIHTAIKDARPTTNLKACHFHLGQAWFCKMQSLGLAKPYMKPGEMSKYLKLFFRLPFLRPDEVDGCFVTDIIALLPPNNSKFTAFTDYILEVYVREDSRYPPSLWAECSSSITRTTNACKSFHSKLNISISLHQLRFKRLGGFPGIVFADRALISGLG
ncbi:hypothetical protein QTP88_007687 [Uroleucon formosanum]